MLVTANPGKLLEARRLCGSNLRSADIDLPEIQSLDLQEVLRHKGVAAAQAIQGPVIVEDTALELAALNSFPGVLVKWMQAAIGIDGLARTARKLGDQTATARCGLLLIYGSTSLAAEGVTEGRLVLPARGDSGFGWDPIFEPAGESRTYAELSASEKDRIGHRGRAWRHLLAQVAGQSKPG